MILKEEYIRIHNNYNSYTNEIKKVGYTSFESIFGWVDYIIDDNLVYKCNTRRNEFYSCYGYVFTFGTGDGNSSFGVFQK